MRVETGDEHFRAGCPTPLQLRHTISGLVVSMRLVELEAVEEGSVALLFVELDGFAELVEVEGGKVGGGGIAGGADEARLVQAVERALEVDVDGVRSGDEPPPPLPLPPPPLPPRERVW